MNTSRITWRPSRSLVAALIAVVLAGLAAPVEGQTFDLLKPPVGTRRADGTYSPEYGAPLKDWERERSFDSAEKCQDAQAELAKKAQPTMDSEKALTLAKARASAEINSQCIKSDDPRLK
jgi:hypothetical protein